MFISRSLKTVALAATVVVATAGASFAATAWVDHDANVKFKPKNNSQTINWVQEGQKVTILAQNGNWVKVKIPGQDGWVKKNALDYNNNWNNNPWPNNGNGSVCINGQYGSICLGH